MTIVLRSLVVRSSGTTLVNGVSLSLAPGSRTALVGASGAGKSLTCAALAGTLPASLEVAGSLTVEPDDADPDNDPRASSDRRGDVGGVNLLGLPAARRPRGSRIALVPQDHSTALHPLIAVGRQIALASQAAGRTLGEADQRATDYLYAVGLDEKIDALPSELSGGQAQRVAICRAIINRPNILLADEPTGNLDSANSRTITDIFHQINRQLGTTVVIVTHNQQIAGEADRVIELRDGAIVRDTAATNRPAETKTGVL